MTNTEWYVSIYRPIHSRQDQIKHWRLYSSSLDKLSSRPQCRDASAFARYTSRTTRNSAVQFETLLEFKPRYHHQEGRRSQSADAARHVIMAMLMASVSHPMPEHNKPYSVRWTQNNAGGMTRQTYETTTDSDRITTVMRFGYLLNC